MPGLIDLFVVVVPVAAAAALIAATRGICYFSGHVRTDGEKMVKMAEEIKLLAWPSRMHNIPYGRGHLREYWVIALKLLMNVTGMKASDHANVALALIANALASVLVYYVARSYFGDLPALFVYLLYVTSVWPYHTAIFMGHVLLSQAVFLLAILALRLTGVYPDIGLMLFLGSGILIGISFSSSSASRKFPALFVAAFLYQTRSHLALPFATDYNFGRLIDGQAAVIFGVVALALAAFFLSAGPLGTVGVRWVGTLRGKEISAKNLTWFASFASRQIRFYAVVSIVATAALYLFQPDAGWYAKALACLAGLGLVIAHISLPNVIRTYEIYRIWLNPKGWASHFQVYTARSKEIFGETLPPDYRGGGILWVPRLLMRMIPLVAVTYMISAAAILGIYASDVMQDDLTVTGAGLKVVALAFVSLLPLIIGELSKSLQVGKAYFSALIGLLVLIGAAAAVVVDLAGNNSALLSGLAVTVTALVIGQAVQTVRSLATDQLPSRMGTDRLYRFLRDRGVKKFSTYDNPYNNCFVDVMLYCHPREFEVEYITSIQDIQEGLVVVPPTSSKSVDMESDSFAAQNGDFRSDPTLADLLDTRQIEKISLARFNTMGSSRYYVQESEVTSYRDIFLHQIGDHDRWLGHAWVVDSKLVRPSA